MFGEEALELLTQGSCLGLLGARSLGAKLSCFTENALVFLNQGGK